MAYNPLSTNLLYFDYNTFSLAFAEMNICFSVIMLYFILPIIHRFMISIRWKLEVVGIFWLEILYLLKTKLMAKADDKN